MKNFSLTKLTDKLVYVLIVIYTILFVSSLVSCKSVKKHTEQEKKEVVEKEKDSTDIKEKSEKNSNTNITIDKQTDEVIYEPIDKAKPMVLPDGKTYENTKVTEKKKASKKVYKQAVSEKKEVNTKKDTQKDKAIKHDKKVSDIEKEPKGVFWNWWWIFVILAGITLIITKYIKWRK